MAHKTKLQTLFFSGYKGNFCKIPTEVTVLVHLVISNKMKIKTKTIKLLREMDEKKSNKFTFLTTYPV